MQTVEEQQDRAIVSKPPRGRSRLKWLGPALIWMLSAAGSGEVLFTPRIASRYGYALIWALMLCVIFKWCINREIGRYTVCTGAGILQGIRSLAGYGKYLLGLLILPQIIVAISTISGLAAAAATAVALLVKWPLGVLAPILLLPTTAVVVLGRYRSIEKIISVLAIVISLTVLAAAAVSNPDLAAMIGGLKPSIPPQVDMQEVLSWLGFMLAGAAGLMWFSYWIQAKGYGAAGGKGDKHFSLHGLSAEEIEDLRGWIGQMTLANTVAVAGSLIIAFAFLILGTELLRPDGLMPEDDKVAATLGLLLGRIVGTAGFWFMVAAVFVTFMGSMLSGQDGFMRMFAEGGREAVRYLGKRRFARQKKVFEKVIAITLLGIVPAVVCAVSGEPLTLLKLAGTIELCHIPVVAGMVLYLNRQTLPKPLKPSLLSMMLTIAAGVFFAAFGIVFLLELLGLIELTAQL